MPAKKTPAPHAAKTTAKETGNANWQTMTLDQFNAALDGITVLTDAYVNNVTAALGGTPHLTDEERAHAPRIPEAKYPGYQATLEVADRRPETFRSLADKDHGKDPGRFETDLLRERLDKHQGLARLAKTLAPVSGLFGDAPLALALQISDPLSQAYGLAKSLAAVDDEIRSVMADALSYNSSVGKAAARSRAANKKNQPK